jgi:hypothetical protein
MLRRPSIRHTQRLGEGCSSTAFGTTTTSGVPVWDNPACRGSGTPLVVVVPALP